MMLRLTSGVQIVMDFDYTMTKCFTEGNKRGASCHCLIEDSGFLNSEYRTQAKALFNYYYPLEVSPSLTLEEKIPLMKEWVDRAHNLLLTRFFVKSSY
jgi:cytosolic 5'-nucleotidase 3